MSSVGGQVRISDALDNFLDEITLSRPVGARRKVAAAQVLAERSVLRYVRIHTDPRKAGSLRKQ